MPRSPALPFSAAAGLALVACGALCQEPPAPLTQPATINGLTGLIRVPTAEILPDGLYHLVWTPPYGGLSKSMAGRVNYSIGMSVLPRTELSLSLSSPSLATDLALHGKYQIRPGGAGKPALAVGVVDAGRNFESENTAYAVATWRVLNDRAALTLGGSAGGNKGLLAGAQCSLYPWLTLQAEFDGDRANAGVVLQHGRTWLRAADTNAGTAVTVGFAAPLTSLPVRRPATASAASSGSADAVAQAVAALGMEDVRTAISGGTLTVAYENRVYTLDEADGMLAVFGVLAGSAPAEATTWRLVPQRRGIALAEVATSPAAYRSFASGSMSADQFATQCDRVFLPGKAAGLQGAALNAITGRTDLEIGPGIKTQIGTETGVAKVGISVRPEATVQLSRGAVANARMSLPLGGDLYRYESKKLRTDRAILAYAFAPAAGWLAQVSAGRYPGSSDGAVLELLHAPTSRLLLRATGGFANNDLLENLPFGVAEAIYSLPAWNAYVRLLGGRFVSSDSGAGIDLVRFFGQTQVALALRSTTRSDTIGVRVSLPLGPRVQPSRPSAMRVRTPSYLDYTLRSAMQSSNFLYLADETAQELSIGPDLIDGFTNRYRLLPSGNWFGAGSEVLR